MAFLGELRLYAGATPPPGWLFCIGQPLPVSGNEDVAALLGTTFGGDGVTQIVLPDLQSRTPVGAEVGFVQPGITFGTETATLEIADLAPHSHDAGCAGIAQNTIHTSGGVLANATGGPNPYSTSAARASLASGTVGFKGGGFPHNNVQPYTAVQFMICVAGGIAPVAGVSVGGAFSNFGGVLQLVGFSNLVMAGYARTNFAEFSRSVYTGLFSLIGTTFGPGDGALTFNGYDLRGKAINGTGAGPGLSSFAVGDVNGEIGHPLVVSELPSHNHDFIGLSDTADSQYSVASFLGESAIFQTVPDGTTMSPSMVSSSGGTVNELGVIVARPHPNQQPLIGITILMAVDDVTPDFDTGTVVIGPWASAPTGFHDCDGSSFLVASQPDLFAVIDYAFGGSGLNAKYPDFRGRIPVGVGQATGFSNYPLGQTGGEESHPLIEAEMPAHTHRIYTVATAGGVNVPAGNLLARNANQYKLSGTPVTLNADAIRPTGSGSGHNNLMPEVAFGFFIKL